MGMDWRRSRRGTSRAESRRVRAGLLLLTAVLSAACATRYSEPAAGAPHATLSFPAQQAQIDSGLFLEPLAFNGVPRPRDWLREIFRVPPGELELDLRAAHEARQGRCLLVFQVIAGETYEVTAEELEDAFRLRAARGDQVMAECSGEKTVLPTPMGIPGVIPPNWSARP
jgi:hypothetical protein